MSDQVNATAQVKFLNNMELLLQAQRSKIYSKIAQTVDVAGSEKAKLRDQFGAVSMIEITDRHGDTQYSNTPHESVWLTKPNPRQIADLVDRYDQKGTSIEIGSGYMKTQVAAVNRYWDDQALRALYGTMITGKDGTTQTPLPGSATLAVTIGGAAGNQRMNTEKLRAATKYLLDNDNDLDVEEKFIVVSQEQAEDLTREVPTTSNDYASAYMGQFDPKTGYHVRLLGWNIITVNLKSTLYSAQPLTLDGSGFRRNPFWVESGLAKGEWERLFTGVDVLPAKRYSKQYYADSLVNVTRTQTGKTGIILNSEA
jgi:Phage capsid protein